MVKKLIIIGVDGMDWDVVREYECDLPTISSMMKRSKYPHLRSVFPADTTPAWSTIYTGLDPSKHGIINFLNVGDKLNAYKPLSFDDFSFKGRVFWDKLNQQGLRCAVILPMNIKEGWEIDGLMITRPHKGRMCVYPQSRYVTYHPKVGLLGTEGKFTSEKQFGKIIKEYVCKAEEEFRLTKLAIENEECDVLFSYFSVIDGIQHDFWRHCDPTHPEYPGDNEYKDVIRDMYKRIDNYIGKIQKMLPDTPMLLISDHGHGARPVYIARINEMLRRRGYLTPRQAGIKKDKKFDIKKWVKKTSLTFVKKRGLPKWAVKIAKKFPVWKGIFASSNDFDWSKTIAYLSDLSALKNYSYGGIRISESVKHKKALCDEIITYLKTINIDGEDSPAFLWIKRTDELYNGEYLSRYPEIIFQMDERYGADWNLGEKLFEKQGFMHRLSPGAHRYETAVIASNGFLLDKTQYEMTDIYSLIMKISLQKE
ncbi:alkaline phosphatase family protein [Desulfosporosinus sp. OT]|uniref:alkaline phosphatase family protein n=1 Tax=Desulfosporosinus sp. OT TaxID=913865 RepID=UPI000223A933|nr:alkaline phosphatase family protein [Desulfosporosinus sp. OT]EGW38469.1 type I phosphodiesterase / nucleotide pyrophosphatase family protein [Desulfosporosinus sp. OT]